MKLAQALNITSGDVVSFVGAGGKSSTLFALGYELVDAGMRVIAITTTRIGEDQLSLAPYAMRLNKGLSEVSAALEKHSFVFLYDELRNGKVYGFDPSIVTELLDNLNSDVMLIEADGSRQLPFKAPYDHEPVIPLETSLVVPMASLSVLGQPLDDDHVYNAQAMIDRYGFYPGSRVKSPWVAQVLRDEELGLRGIPDRARVVVLLNQTPEHGYLRARARLIARLILRSPRIQGVAIGAVRGATPVFEVQRSVGAIVLAAGMSRRMGQPKVLLPWTSHRTIIEHILEQLLLAKVDHITVVTGHRAPEVQQKIERYGVDIVYNSAYDTGEMLSSVKAGLQAMPTHVSAALIVLGDQPRLQPKVIGQLTTAYAEGAGNIMAPSFQNRRGHPILIDRRYWPEILGLPDDGAPRDVLNVHTKETGYVIVDNDSVLKDVDTPTDYRDERRNAGLEP